jgi:dUTP pyrophosphatase
VFDGRIRLNYVKIHPDAVDPKYNYGTDSCFDLHSVIDYELGGFQRALIPTGLKFDIPAYNELQVRTKSGLAINQGLVVLNSPGTIDSGYNGEIKVIVYNTTSESIFIKKQQKIAQCGLYPVYVGSVVILQQLDSIQEKDRGENGFGSTGI